MEFLQPSAQELRRGRDGDVAAVGFFANELLPQGRDPQSMAFFSTPGTLRLMESEARLPTKTPTL
nr:hypothetical protein [Arthrobacter wenxiniae]